MAQIVGSTELNPLPDPTQGIKNAFALRAMGQEAQLRQEQITGAQQENQQRQIQLQDTQAMSAAMHDWDGKDINALPPLILKHNGSANAVFGMKQKILEQQQTYSTIAKNDSETGSKNLETIQKKNDMLLGALNGVTSGPDEGIGQRLTDAIGSASQQGLIDPQHAQSVMQMAQLDPQSLRKQLSIFEKGFQGNAAQIEQAKNEAETAKNAAQSREAEVNAQQKQIQTAASQLGTIKDKDSYAQAWGELPAKIARTFPSPEQWTPQSAAMIQRAGMTPEQQVTSQQGAQRIGIEAGRLSEEQRHNKAVEGLLSPQAKDMAAENYFSTGQLPAGARSPAVITSIINRAAELHPGGNVAANSAEYKANVDSLKKIVPQRDAVVAFENTAGKNLDLFLGQAKKVIDTGSPFLNTPLRIAADKLSGSPDQAAYNAARQVAVNEIAKVVSNPNLSGTLSDSARNEISAFNPQNATLAQTYRVAQILKQDMANRHEAYDMQIADIKKRVGDKNAGQQHVIQMSGKNYQYKGSGDTSDIKNYTLLP